MAKKTPITGELREALRRSEVSRYRLWQETGIEQSTLSRFLAGSADMSMASADVLAERLGVRLAPDVPPKKIAKKTPKTPKKKKKI
jgi:hypothetical protein